MEDVTEDRIYGGRVLVRQPARGYRVNVDTILLAASLPPAGAAGRIVEPGCGVGGAILSVARAHEGRPETSFVGIERDPLYARLAAENVAANGLDGHVRIVEADALDPPEELGLFDHVLINPPYDYDGEGRPPAEWRRGAYVAERPIADWIKVWSNRMRGQASLTLIQRPQRLPEILTALEGRLGGVDIFPIRPNANSHARRVIVRAWKGSRAPLKLHPGLDLHRTDASEHKYTPEAEAILRGEAALWSA